MKYLSFFLIFTLFSSCGITKKQPSPYDLSKVNIIDQNGFSETITNPDRLQNYQNVNFSCPQPYQKVLRVYHPDQQGNAKSYITSYYDNGQIKQYLEILNSRAYGTYKEWYDNGQIKLSSFVIGGAADLGLVADQSWLFEGISQAWDEDGCLQAEICYSHGVLNGCSTYYHDNGSIWKTIPFENDLPHGEENIYLSNGNLLQTTTWCNGELHGPLHRYWNDCSLATEELFQHNRLISGMYCDPKGKPISSIERGNGYRPIFAKNYLLELHQYKNGLQEGDVQVFTPNGVLFRQYKVKDDQKHGEDIVYYIQGPSQAKKLSIYWYQGKMQGLVRTWYPNGTLESQKEMSDNKKNGIFTAWYKDGSLLIVEEYDNDQLVKGEYYKKGQRIPASEVSYGEGTATIFDADGHFIRKITYKKGRPVP